MKLLVKDHTLFPGPRYKILGEYSGEWFRDDILIPLLASTESDLIQIDLDGTVGYGSSFLEEVFGGLVRKKIPENQIQSILDNIISTEDESLIFEIKSYVKDEQERQARS